MGELAPSDAARPPVVVSASGQDLAATQTSSFGDWRRAARLGYLIAILGFGGSVAWAATARLDGAAVATGVVAVESSRKTIQHLEGGIIRELLVRNGDVVREGQVLLRLDPTRVDAQGELFGNLLVVLLAQEARLVAERDELPDVTYPQEVLARRDAPPVARALLDQSRQFQSRRDALIRNREVAQAQIDQIRREMEQNDVDHATASATLKNVLTELGALRPLYERQLVPTTRVAPLEREKLRLEGAVSNSELQALKLKQRLAEAELKRDQVGADYRQDAANQLHEVRRQLNDTRQQLVVATDSQRRAELKAPTDGTIQQLRIFTIGGVLRPGDPVLDLVPLSDTLIIQTKISPLDIDRVSPGRTAEVRFPSFRYFGSEIVRGTLRSVSRDRLIEDNGKDAYFAAEIVVDRGGLPPEIAPRLSAGIPADIIIPTEERTALAFLLEPIFERMNRSMRER